MDHRPIQSRDLELRPAAAPHPPAERFEPAGRQPQLSPVPGPGPARNSVSSTRTRRGTGARSRVSSQRALPDDLGVPASRPAPAARMSCSWEARSTTAGQARRLPTSRSNRGATSSHAARIPGQIVILEPCYLGGCFLFRRDPG